MNTRHTHDAAAIERARGVTDDMVDELIAVAESEGQRRERKRLQPVLIGMAAVAAFQAVVIFCMAVWR